MSATVAACFLLLAACMSSTSGSTTRDQDPVRAPTCEVYKISGPTVIAFFEYEGCRNIPYCEDALEDFQVYLGRMRERLDESAIRIYECYRQSFEVEVRGQRRRVAPQKDVGYYLISPDKVPRFKLGVVTDSDLVQLMNDYFGPDVVNKALVRPK